MTPEERFDAALSVVVEYVPPSEFMWVADRLWATIVDS